MTMLWPKDPNDPILRHHSPDSIDDLFAMQEFCMREVPDGFDEWPEQDQKSYLAWAQAIDDSEREFGYGYDREERDAALAMCLFAKQEMKMIEFRNRRIAHATTHP